jgi:hypothetical protein
VTNKLREAEVLLSQGSTEAQASGKVGITEQPFHRKRFKCIITARGSQEKGE